MFWEYNWDWKLYSPIMCLSILGIQPLPRQACLRTKLGNLLFIVGTNKQMFPVGRYLSFSSFRASSSTNSSSFLLCWWFTLKLFHIRSLSLRKLLPCRNFFPTTYSTLKKKFFKFSVLNCLSMRVDVVRPHS